MAGSKKNKLVRQKQVPVEKSIAQGGNPEQYYAEYPAWSFSNSDSMMWAFSREHIGDFIRDEIFPRMKSLETQTWSEILVKDCKQNHSIDVNELNKVARGRLVEIYGRNEKDNFTFFYRNLHFLDDILQHL